MSTCPRQVSEHLRFTKDDSDEEKVASLAGVVAVGDGVWVKVVEVEGAEAGGRVKVGCSMKVVNQGSGVDLDPNNTHYRPRGAPRGGGDDALGDPGGEAAVVRAGVVQWGHHLAAVKSLDGRAYELLKEEEPQAEPPSRVETKEAMLRSVGGGGAGGGDFLSEPATAAEPVHIGSVEEAQKILARYQRKAEKREAKKAKKMRKAEKKSKKESKKQRRSKSSSFTSS
jgi:hypothetical protein